MTRDAEPVVTPVDTNGIHSDERSVAKVGLTAYDTQCSGWGSNPHEVLPQGILSPSRLPVSPPERGGVTSDW